MEKLYFWVDLETTGLHAKAPTSDTSYVPDQIMEIAVILTTYSFDVVDTYSRLVEWDKPVEIWHEKVVSIHNENGLLKSFDSKRHPVLSVSQVEDELCELLMKHGVFKKKCLSPAGRAVHFDVGFIDAYLPKVARCLSHSPFEVATLYKLLRLRFTEDQYTEFTGMEGTKHRALDDILHDLHITKTFYQALLA